MPNIFDAVLISNDMSLDRVLHAGLPAVLIFHNDGVPADLRQGMDELARRFAGKALIVTLAHKDAPRAAARFNIRSFPSVVTVREGKMVTHQENVKAADLNAHTAYLLGEGPAPKPSRPEAGSGEAGRQEAGAGPISVNEAEFEREVLRADRPVLVDFWAPWCAPCRMVAPLVDAVARDHPQSLKVVKVNVDESPALANRYHATSIPTMIVMKGGEEVDRWVGALPENMLRSRLARWIQSEPQAS